MVFGRLQCFVHWVSIQFFRVQSFQQRFFALVHIGLSVRSLECYSVCTLSEDTVFSCTLFLKQGLEGCFLHGLFCSDQVLLVHIGLGVQRDEDAVWS